MWSLHDKHQGVTEWDNWDAQCTRNGRESVHLQYACPWTVCMYMDGVAAVKRPANTTHTKWDVERGASSRNVQENWWLSSCIFPRLKTETRKEGRWACSRVTSLAQEYVLTRRDSRGSRNLTPRRSHGNNNISPAKRDSWKGNGELHGGITGPWSTLLLDLPSVSRIPPILHPWCQFRVYMLLSVTFATQLCENNALERRIAFQTCAACVKRMRKWIYPFLQHTHEPLVNNCDCELINTAVSERNEKTMEPAHLHAPQCVCFHVPRCVCFHVPRCVCFHVFVWCKWDRSVGGCGSRSVSFSHSSQKRKDNFRPITRYYLSPPNTPKTTLPSIP